MSAICGFAGPGDPGTIQRMLDAVAYRGDRSAIASEAGVGIGYRFWGDRPGKSDGVLDDATQLAAIAGSFAPPQTSPAGELARLLTDPARLATLDGNFAAAHWDKDRRRLTLLRDPFGVRCMVCVVQRACSISRASSSSCSQFPACRSNRTRSTNI